MATMSKSRKPSKSAPWPDKLKYLRDVWGDGATPLTQKLAAERFGVSLRSWAGWELGTQVPSGPVCRLIDVLLNDPSADLK